MKWLLLLILAAIFFIIGKVMNTLKKDWTGPEVDGIIDKSIQEDGFTYFWIGFDVDGKHYSVPSEYYHNARLYFPGDKVRLQYHQLSNGKITQTKVIDERITPVDGNVSKHQKFCYIIAAVLVVLAIASGVFGLK